MKKFSDTDLSTLSPTPEKALTFSFPKHLEHPASRINLTAAHLLDYWANKGVIPRYGEVIKGLREGADTISKASKPVAD